MTGFGEEAGVIPRFCQELFYKLSSVQNNEVSISRCGISLPNL